jgi:hypothetical protein
MTAPLMTRLVLGACLVMVCSLALGRDPTPLPLQEGERVGIVNLMDSEVTHLHNAKVLVQGFLKTLPVDWPLDAMLDDAVIEPLTHLGLIPVTLEPGDALIRNLDDFFGSNSVAKGLPRQVAGEFAALAASEHVDALIVLAPGPNNSSQGAVRKGLPDDVRGWGFVTDDGTEKPFIFNITQLLLISVTPDGATLRAREWGGNYADEWVDYRPPPDLKHLPPDELEKLQPLFARILGRQAARLTRWITSHPKQIRSDFREAHISEIP